MASTSKSKLVIGVGGLNECHKGQEELEPDRQVSMLRRWTNSPCRVIVHSHHGSNSPPTWFIVSDLILPIRASAGVLERRLEGCANENDSSLNPKAKAGRFISRRRSHVDRMSDTHSAER
jgi:hypothetical protein